MSEVSICLYSLVFRGGDRCCSCYSETSFVQPNI
nr:MAG TPA: hypothetical protein [Caudoviricetes sp.]